MKGMGGLVSWAILIAGIAGIVYPAFIEGVPGTIPPGFTQSVISIFIEPERTLGYFMRVLCLIFAIGAGYLVFISYWFRDLPLTAVRTDITVSFNADFSQAVLHREQILRTNQPEVTAYFTATSPSSPTGTIPRDLIKMTAFCHGVAVADDFDCAGSERGYEIIQFFGTTLPYRWYMPLIPIRMISKDADQIPKILRSYVVSRSQTITYFNEFNVPDPVMTFVASNYPQFNISVTLVFPDTPPASLKALRVKSTGVTLVGHQQMNHHRVRVHVDSLRNETLRISWKSPVAA